MATVRRIREDEGDALRDVRLRALADAPDAFGQGAEDARARSDEEWAQAARQGSRGDSRAWLVAEREGGSTSEGRSFVGVVLARRRPPDTVMVFSMWVDPDVRRGGVGRELIDAVSDWARSWGGRRMVLWVFASNESAIRFYQRLGFATETEGDDAASGRAYGALAMSRPVPADDDGSI